MYETINHQLIEDLPKLVDLRVPYLDPSFEALIKCQIKFAGDAYARLSELKTELEQAGLGSNLQSNQLDGRVEAVLQQLRDLTIVGQRE
jgi:hypothetical protein